MFSRKSKSLSQQATQLQSHAREASEQARDYAQGVRDAAEHFISAILSFGEDQRTMGQEAISDAQGMISDAVSAGVESGRSYARDAVDRAGRRIGQVKEQGARYVADAPVQSILVAFGAAAVLAALILVLTRDDSE